MENIALVMIVALFWTEKKLNRWVWSMCFAILGVAALPQITFWLQNWQLLLAELLVSLADKVLSL